jgi:hypothetical protein
VIETLEVAMRRAIHERSTTARQALLPSVRPIVASVYGARPRPLGTCMLFEIDGRRFAVTAAHVLDEMPDYALHIIGTARTEPVQIRGKILQSAEPPGGRPRDKIDVGYWEMSPEASRQLGKVRFLTAEDCSLNRVNVVGRQYMAMGFPYSRNARRINHARRTITPTIRTYTAEVVEHPALATELGVLGDQHFFLDFKSTSFLADESRANSFAPTGMSGGPLVDLGDFGAVVENYGPERRATKVAGMLIEWHKAHDAIVALKIEHVVRAIQLGRDLEVRG